MVVLLAPACGRTIRRESADDGLERGQLRPGRDMGYGSAAGGVHLWPILALQALAGGADGAFNPARETSPQVVSPSRLQQANALLGITGSASGVAGPVLAAGLVTAGSPGIALLVDAATFLVSAAFLTRVRTTRPERSGSRFFGELSAGWSEFRAQEWLWKAVGLVCISNLRLRRTSCSARSSRGMTWAGWSVGVIPAGHELGGLGHRRHRGKAATGRPGRCWRASDGRPARAARWRCRCSPFTRTSRPSRQRALAERVSRWG